MSIVAVVPARDEALRLPHALGALTAQGVDVIVVANGCTDATAEVAAQCGASVIETPILPGGVGAARRIGMAAALKRAPAWLMTTDADCVLGPLTVTILEQALALADAVFGRVEPCAKEFALLPPAVRRHASLEDQNDALVAQIEALLTDVPWNPAPCHGQSPGALVAFRPRTYRLSGGFAPVRCHEDQIMATALARIGARIARPWAAVVQASCRLDGRAPGGMAATITARTREDLAGETRRLAASCERLKGELARLHAVRSGERAHPPPEGDRHVLSFQQASI